MGAKYALYENPNPKGNGEKQPLHARIVPKGTVRTQEIAEQIADGSGYSTATTKGMLDALAKIIARNLRQGYTVELEDLGSFSLSLKCRPVMDKKELRSWSVRFGNIHFKGSKKMKNQLRSIDLERDSEAKATLYSPEQRKGRILLTLQEREYFTTAQYMRLNGCTRSTAARDIKEMIESGKIKKLGYGKAVLYAPVEK
ncbi:MAG: HU family DNA-binding protein [Parabacteroides sp.]|nr:HU family DNA-binding protein [Parabacteroides sp.]